MFQTFSIIRWASNLLHLIRIETDWNFILVFPYLETLFFLPLYLFFFFFWLFYLFILQMLTPFPVSPLQAPYPTPFSFYYTCIWSRRILLLGFILSSIFRVASCTLFSILVYSLLLRHKLLYLILKQSRVGFLPSSCLYFPGARIKSMYHHAGIRNSSITFKGKWSCVNHMNSVNYFCFFKLLLVPLISSSSLLSPSPKSAPMSHKEIKDIFPC